MLHTDWCTLLPAGGVAEKKDVLGSGFSESLGEVLREARARVFSQEEREVLVREAWSRKDGIGQRSDSAGSSWLLFTLEVD